MTKIKYGCSVMLKMYAVSKFEGVCKIAILES